MKKKDPNYQYAKELINGGSITSLKAALAFVSLRQLARDSEVMSYSTLQTRSYNPGDYTVDELVELGKLFDLPTAQVLALALNDKKSEKPIKKS